MKRLVYDELVLQNEAKIEADEEKKIVRHSVPHLIELPSRYVPLTLHEGYKFSLYVIDPIRFRFKKVVRVLGKVISFVHKLLGKINHSYTSLFGCSEKKIPDVISRG